MGDSVDQLIDVLRKGKLALTIEGATLAHAFLPPGTRNPTLQVSSPGEVPRYHLRVFVDRGELVFLVADQDVPTRTPEGRPHPERHPWAVRVPIAASIAALERDLGDAALVGFRERLFESFYPAKIEGMKGVWVLIGMFDGELPLDEAAFDGETTRLGDHAMGSVLRRARIVSGEVFCNMENQIGLVVEPDKDGNPTSHWFIYSAPRGVPGIPGWVVALAVRARPAMLEWTRFALTMLETARPIVQARSTGFTLPAFPDPAPMVDDVLRTVDRHLLGMRMFGGLVYPWEPGFQQASVTPSPLATR